MKVLLSWLREFGRLPGDAATIADRLAMGGLEVEERFDVAMGLAGVRVAEIRAVMPHPDAERLSVCTVYDGEAERQVVCGAANARPGARAAYAPPGVVLPGGRLLEEVEIRGVASAGMLCSEEELGLAERSPGILLLEKGRPGQPLAESLGLADESLLTLGVTPNRPDWLSHQGVAREAAALLRGRFEPRPVDLTEGGTPAAELARVDIEDAERCPRYAARIVEGVTVAPSPPWLQQRLELCGVRAINNVVDATNYVLLELGHPLHAFDLDLLLDQRIIVRRPRAGEVLTTLDGQNRELDPDDLVIADGQRPVALAGVMGGAETEVGDRTTRLLLESAYFERRGIRRTARRHGMHTEASHRFERGADPEMVVRALDRVAELIVTLAGGEIRGGVVEAHPAPVRRPSIRLRWNQVSDLLGVEVSADEAVEHLTRLGITLRGKSETEGVFDPPSWRPDLERDVDLIEEVARLRGYERIPATLPAIRLSQAPAPRSAAQRLAALAADSLVACGLSEALNYSFVSTGMIEAMGFPEGDRRGRTLPLRNPISEEMAVMRTSLLPGLLRNVAHNLRHGVSDVHLFEVGRVFWGRDGEPLPEERLVAAAVRSGIRRSAGWDRSDAPVDFYDAKGVVEELLGAAGWDRVQTVAGRFPALHPRAAAEILLGGQRVGVVGELHPNVLEAFDIEQRVVGFEIDLSRVGELPVEEFRFAEVPRFPPVYRDMAVVVDREVPWETIRELARSVASAITAEVRVFDVYTGKPVPEGKKSVAFAVTYQSPDRTLTDEEVGRVHEGIQRRLEERLGARIRE